MSEIASPRQQLVLGERIAVARRAAGLTQRQLADALGTTPWSVERLESGSGDATLHLSAIANATHRQQDWFLGVPPETSPVLTDSARAGDLGVVGRNLVLGSLTLLVTIRFFTEVVPVAPRAANFIDIPIFLALAVASMAIPRARRGSAYLNTGGPVLAFMLLALTSAIVNAGRTAPAPVLVFVYGFLAPIAVYAAVYRLWPPGNARSLSRLLVGLGLVQLVVVTVIGIPRFIASSNPDVISGTFGTNAYQLVFFLLVVAALLAGIFTLERERSIARFVPLLILAIFCVVILAQYRALLATTIVTIVVVGLLLGKHARGIGLAVFAAVAFAITFQYIAANFPVLKLETTAKTLSESPWSYASQRLEAARPAGAMLGDIPSAIATGTGPGTFSSRAWQTFANAGSTSSSNVQGAYARALSGGVYTTDVSEKYIEPQLAEGLIVEGSRALSQPYSSYSSLAAEVGLVGLALIVGLYLAATLRIVRVAHREIAHASAGDSVPALALATVVGFLTLLQMGVLENWLEVTRVTFVLWAMFGVVSKEIDARSRLQS